MKKKPLFLVATLVLSLSFAVPVFAGSSVGNDSYLSVYTSFSSSGGTLVRGEATANSIADYKTHVNLSAKLYKKNTNTVLDQGIETSNGINDAVWSSYQAKSGSYTLQAAARTYFSDGNYSDQKYSTANW